jgi:Winged helix-turn helix
MKTALRMWKLPAVQRERIQMVLLRESGMTQPEIAEAMGVSLSTVNRAHMAYDAGGIKALKPKPIDWRQAAREHDASGREGVAGNVCQGRWGGRVVERPGSQ